MKRLFSVLALTAATLSSVSTDTFAQNAEEPVARALGAYVGFQTDVSSLAGGKLASAGDLDTAMERAAGQNRDALTQGWIAYGAMTAAQSKEFVASVRETAGFYGKDAFVRGLLLDPGYAESLAGGAEAKRKALEAARADGTRVFAVGERYKEQAYSVQNAGWAKAVAPGQDGRLAKLKALAAGAATRPIDASMSAAFAATPGASSPTAIGSRAFWDTLRGAAPAQIEQTALAASGPAPLLKPHRDRGSAFQKMTTIAALMAIDATADAQAQDAELLNDRPTRNCIEMAQAQFYQCVSAARFRYENVFCLGEHALKDMGSCIRDSATVQDAATAAIAPPNAPN